MLLLECGSHKLHESKTQTILQKYSIYWSSNQQKRHLTIHLLPQLTNGRLSLVKCSHCSSHVDASGSLIAAPWLLTSIYMLKRKWPLLSGAGQRGRGDCWGCRWKETGCLACHQRVEDATEIVPYQESDGEESNVA